MESKASERERCKDDPDDGSAAMCKDKEEEDGVSYVGLQSFLSPGFIDGPKSNVQGLHLNTKLVRKSSSRGNANEGNENLRQVIPVTVVFDLPDGSQVDQEFQLGQTVEVLKGFVESEIGIPMSCQELYLGSTLMMDPMSLLDYPGIDGTGDVLIAVEGEIIDEAKK